MGVKVMAFTNIEDYPFWVSMVGTSECDKNYHINRINSSVYTLEYVLEGQGNIFEDSKSAIAIKGDTWLLHAGRNQEYYTDPEKPWRKIWINFGGPLADYLVAAYGLDEFYYPCTNILPLLEEFHNTVTTIENHRIAFDKCAIIFHRICQQLYNQHYTGINSVGTIAEEMKRYIDTNSEIDLSLDALVRRIHCSKAYAIRSFKKRYNITPYNYILNRKIELAKYLLINTNISIVDVAEQLAMCDSHYFSKCFKKHTGISPSEFRRQHSDIQSKKE